MTSSEHTSITYSVLGNGLDFVESALDRLSGEPSPRDIKYAVLHMCSGLELVMKERLQSEHWALLFAEIKEASQGKFDSGDFTSVAFQPLQERLEKIARVRLSDSDKDMLGKFRRLRNRLEHFRCEVSAPHAIVLTVQAVSFLIRFIKRELPIGAENPEEQEAMARVRSKLSGFKAFLQARYRQMELVPGSAIVQCPECKQVLLLDNGADCLFCDYHAPGEEAAKRYVEKVLGLHKCEEVKGDDWPIYLCPECGCESLVDHSTMEPGRPRFFCFSCGNCWSIQEMDFCDRCRAPFASYGEPWTLCLECHAAVVGDD